MKSVKIIGVAAALLVLGCVTALEAPDALALLRRYDDAWLRKDVAGFADTLSPAYVYFSSSGAKMNREAILRMLASPEYTIESGSRAEIETFRSGSVVIVSTRWKGRGTSRGKPFVDDQRCSVVIALDAKPAVLAEHCTNLDRTE